MFLNRKLSLVAGLICGLSFAPVFFTPGILMLSVFCNQISASKTSRQSAIFGYLFGLGFFLSTLYWISFGVSVYIEEFWWAIPFALLGLPAFMALFITIQAYIAWHFRNYKLYHFLFCIFWLFVEWLISWIFTGFPWGMLGYSLSVSNILIQPASVFGILGLSFLVVYVGSSLYSRDVLVRQIIVCCIISAIILLYGKSRLGNNPTELSEIKVRIVQPSISQIAKWNPNIFWKNLDIQIKLSKQQGEPDIIVWPEATLTAPYYYKPIYNSLMSIFSKDAQILLSGGVSDNAMQKDNYEIYSSLLAITSSGNLLFDYHKSHLVPFGEYMPLSKYLPVKKLTPGIVDYTPGKREIVYLKMFNLYVQPLICYESIFAEEVKISNINTDIMINITNDAWYGKSSGPYQHFEISKMRAIENGLPMIRAGNNGISAIIDPLGRVLGKLKLDQISVLDGYVPLKLTLPTIYSEMGIQALFIEIFCVLIIQLIVTQVLTKKIKNLLYLFKKKFKFKKS